MSSCTCRHNFHTCTCSPPHTELTLTEENLTSLLEGVKDLDGVIGVTFYLHIPVSRQSEIQRQYSSITQRRQEYCRYWLTYHPSPSWLVVANALYMKDECGALEVLQKFYLKGEHKHTVHEPEWGFDVDINNYLQVYYFNNK